MGTGPTKSSKPSQKKTRREGEDVGDDGDEDNGIAEGAEGQQASEKLEDGLSFWVASKTISFKVDEFESLLKKTMLSAGFTVEECSVSEPP